MIVAVLVYVLSKQYLVYVYRWAQFPECVNKIEAGMESLREGYDISYKGGIGSGWFVISWH